MKDLYSLLDRIHRGLNDLDAALHQRHETCGVRWRKPVQDITDRAKRYRANSPGCRPPGPEICAMCGSKRNVEVGHLDGHEEHGEPENLFWTCRRCNVLTAIHFKRHRVGRPTNQYNPAPAGAQTLGQWIAAVMSMKGEADQMKLKDAIAMIRATPAADRSSFAKQIWNLRRKRGTDTQVPF